MTSASVVVVGAGLAGAAAAWRLTLRGHEVTVLERSTPANPWGSSSGSARIFRYAYADPRYVDLVAAARPGWDELARAASVPLLTPTGGLDFGRERQPERLAGVLAERGIEHSLLTAAQARRRWDIAFDGPVLWHPGAAVIDAAAAVEAMLGLASAAGARIHQEAPVTRIEADGAGYAVTTDAGAVHRAAQVVVAAGGWLPDLLGGLPLPAEALARFPTLQVRQQQVHHFPFRSPSGAAGPEWPTFIHQAGIPEVYGLPGGRDAGFVGMKIAEHHRGHPLRSAADHDRQVDPAAQHRMIDFVRRSLPGLEPEPYAVSTCLYTLTPTHDFVIDRLDGITILSPCSGHGAKFAPVIGDLAADLAEGRPGMSDFRPSRRWGPKGSGTSR